MLKVYKGSWHYKVSRIFNQKEPKDLCTYMRQVIKPMFWSVILLTAICGSIYDIYMLSLYGGEEWVWSEMSIFALVLLHLVCGLGWGLMAAILMVAAVCILGVIGYFWEEVLLKPYKEWREEKHEDKEPEPNLLWEWCKAQKQRVCPLIEVVED